MSETTWKGNRLSRYALQVSLRFAVGGVIAALGIMLFPLSLITYPLGGAIGGASLRRGRKPAVGFGLGFLFLGLVVPLMLISYQGRGGDDWGATIAVIGIFVFVYGVAGTIGAALSGLGGRMVLTGAGAFGVAGGIGGAVMEIAFLLSDYIPSDVRGAFFLVTIFLGVLIPHALGGALFAVALEYPSHKRKKLGLCLKCGYDLRGSTERCPECGTPIASTSQR